jgi:CheY-like chemotaxis protein
MTRLSGVLARSASRRISLPEFVGCGSTNTKSQIGKRNLLHYEEGRTTRILIADDSERVRRAVRALLNADSSDWVICGEVEDGRDAVSQVAKLLPDVMLLDVSIPLLNGVEIAQIVKRNHPAGRVVLMSEQDTSVLARLAEAAGTPHFLVKSRLAIDLIPQLTSLGKDSGNPKVAPGA